MHYSFFSFWIISCFIFTNFASYYLSNVFFFFFYESKTTYVSGTIREKVDHILYHNIIIYLNHGYFHNYEQNDRHFGKTRQWQGRIWLRRMELRVSLGDVPYLPYIMSVQLTSVPRGVYHHPHSGGVCLDLFYSCRLF